MKLRAVILGSGNIGCDLLAKVRKSPYLRCVMFVGKRAQSAGLKFAADCGVEVSDRGLEGLIREPDAFDLIFDATSAPAHMEHADLFEAWGKMVINLTPAPRGTWYVPAIGTERQRLGVSVNMITCGGQAAVPLAWAFRQACEEIQYVEAVSAISAASAGPATRSNVDEYLTVTQSALKHFAGARRAKAILNINPADPPVDMQTTVLALGRVPDMGRLLWAVQRVVEHVQTYVPGYELLIPPHTDGEKLMAAVRVTGAGDYLPRYAGNLDIITCAAVRAGEQLYHQTLKARVEVR
jgi:acetaldehyde dehydrogenase